MFLSFLGCVLCVRDLFPICQCVSVGSPSPLGSGRAAYSMLFGSVSRTDSVSRVLKAGFGMRGRSSSGADPSPCLSSSAPPFPSLFFLSFFLVVFPRLFPPLPRPQGVLRRCSFPKMGWFLPPSLVALSRINIEKKKNLTAEWLIQIIVAFSHIKLLFFVFFFFCFPPVQCGIWATCELGPLSEKAEKASDIREDREKERGIQKTWAAL